MAKVELRRVSKVYSTGSTAVLDEVDLSVEDGEFLVLVGPNGSGKTTLLRLIAGLERVTSGEIWLGGQRVTDWPARRRNVAMVFQSGVLYPHLTVEQNLRFGLRKRVSDEGGGIGWFGSRRTNRSGAECVGQRSDGRDQRISEDRVRDMAQQLGIESLLDCLPRQLSGGERQRVALGRALVRQPAVFLLDEPAASVDVGLRRELNAVFQQVRQRVSGTMVMVSHDHAEVLAGGPGGPGEQRLAVLGYGKIQQIGPAHQVYAAPCNRYVAGCLGRTAVNFVDGQWRREGGETRFDSEFGVLVVPAAVGDVVLDGNAERSRQVTLGWRWPSAMLSEYRPNTVGWSGVLQWLEVDDSGTRAFVVLAGNSTARDMTARDMTARDMTARDMTARDMKARDMKARGAEAVTVSARMERPDAFRPGDRVRIDVDLEQAFWFDRGTGTNLRTGGCGAK
jgi:ABC-type sugar transport system ATPase subunit